MSSTTVTLQKLKYQPGNHYAEAHRKICTKKFGINLIWENGSIMATSFIPDKVGERLLSQKKPFKKNKSGEVTFLLNEESYYKARNEYTRCLDDYVEKHNLLNTTL